MSTGNGKKTTEEQILAAIQKGFEEVNTRLDRVIESQGAHWRDHEDRLKKIEAALKVRR